MRVFIIHNKAIQMVAKNEPCQNLTVSFDGKYLRIFDQTEDICFLKAQNEDVFNITFEKDSLPAVIRKEVLPTNRADKIAYCLGFTKKSRYAYSFSDFWHQLHYLLETTENSKNIHTEYIEDVYAFAVAKKNMPAHKSINGKIGLVRNVLIWISPDISIPNLTLLVSKLNEYEELRCPVEFLETL